MALIRRGRKRVQKRLNKVVAAEGKPRRINESLQRIHIHAAEHAQLAALRNEERKGLSYLRLGRKAGRIGGAAVGLGFELPAGALLGSGVGLTLHGKRIVKDARAGINVTEKQIISRRIGKETDEQRIKRRLGLDKQHNLRNRRKMRRVQK